MSFIAELKRRNVFRVCAAYIVGSWAVAQVADLAFDSFGAPDWAMRALLIVLLIGLPVVALAAWALEIGPDGLQVDHGDEEASADYATRVKRRLNVIIAAFVVLGIGLFALTSLTSKERSTTEPPMVEAMPDATPGGIVPSIAVLPFVDMSPAQDQRHLADGVPTELMTALHRVDRLKVVSRTSAFSFRDSGKSIAEIAEALDVDHVVEGSVQRSGNQVRIEAALVDVRSDERLWSESYTQEIGDAFALQAGITRKIAAALSVVVGDEAEADIDQIFEATANPEAYEAFLLGTTLWARRGEKNIRDAIDYLKRAIDLEPNFARAEAALSMAYITLPSYAVVDSYESWSAIVAEVHAQAQIHAQNAIALDPQLATAYLALADLARLDSRWGDADRFYRRALEIDPEDATVNLWYSEHLQDLGLMDRMLEVNQTALTLDPLSPGANANLAGAYLVEADCESLEAPARKAAALGHDFGFFAPIICSAGEKRWRDMLALQEADNQRLQSNPFPNEHGNSAVRFTDMIRDIAEASTESELERAKQVLVDDALQWGDDPTAVLLMVTLDQPGTAIDRILSTPNQKWGGLTKSFWGPFSAPLRAHERFPELLETSGLAEFFLESGITPDDCRRIGDTFDCTPEAL